MKWFFSHDILQMFSLIENMHWFFKESKFCWDIVTLPITWVNRKLEECFFEWLTHLSHHCDFYLLVFDVALLLKTSLAQKILNHLFWTKLGDIMSTQYIRH